LRVREEKELSENDNFTCFESKTVAYDAYPLLGESGQCRNLTNEGYKNLVGPANKLIKLRIRRGFPGLANGPYLEIF
jgi:hypothetical protein